MPSSSFRATCEPLNLGPKYLISACFIPQLRRRNTGYEPSEVVVREATANTDDIDVHQFDKVGRTLASVQQYPVAFEMYICCALLMPLIKRPSAQDLAARSRHL